MRIWKFVPKWPRKALISTTLGASALRFGRQTVLLVPMFARKPTRGSGTSPADRF